MIKWLIFFGLLSAGHQQSEESAKASAIGCLFIFGFILLFGVIGMLIFSPSPLNPEPHPVETMAWINDELIPFLGKALGFLIAIPIVAVLVGWLARRGK